MENRRLDLNSSPETERPPGGGPEASPDPPERLAARGEDNRRYLDFLSRTSRLFSYASDSEALLTEIAHVAVPVLSDWCSVYMLDPNRRIRLLVCAHSDPSKAALAYQLHEDNPTDWHAHEGVGKCLRTAKAVLYSTISNHLLRTMAQNADQLRIVQTLGLKSVMLVPLIARGKTLGAIAFAMAESQRVLSLADLSFAEELASRTALTLDHLRLVQETQDANRHRSESLALLDTLLSTAPVGLAFLDRELRFVRVNDSLSKWLQLSPHRCLGRPLGEVVPQLAPQLEPPLQEVRDLGKPIIGIEVGFHLAADPAHPRYWLVNYYPVRRTEGPTTGVGMVVTEITDRRLLEDGLRKDEERFRLLAEAIPQIVWTARADGWVDYFNQRWYEFTGLLPALTEGWVWKTVLHPDDFDNFLTEWKRALQTATPMETEARFQKSDETFRWHLVRGLPQLDKDGKIVKWFGTCTDIQDQKLNEQALREETRVAETLHRVGALVTSEADIQKLVQSITEEATQLTDAKYGAFFYSTPENPTSHHLLYALTGAPKEAFINFPTPRITDLLRPTFRGEGVVRLDDVTKDPRYGSLPPHHGMPRGHVPVRSYLALPVISRTGEVLGGLFFGHPNPGIFSERDESLAKSIAAQTAIAIDNARLYQKAKAELGERRMAEERLKKQKAELARSNSELERFAYVASHDLKEPLRMVGNYVKLLEKKYRNQLDSEAHEFIDFAVDGVSRMNALINDLLEYSRLGTRISKFKPVDLGKIFDRVTHHLRPSIEESGAEIRRGALPVVIGDEFQLVQLLQNLLSNAIKFRSSETPIVEIDGTSQDDDWLVTVTDNGIGIEPQYRERIFIIFQRLETIDKYPGTGIGLAICKKIVERHGGRIWMESTPRGGSCFCFTLPKVRPETEAEGPTH